MLERLNLRLWLSFGEGKKGDRIVRKLQGGLITTGDAEPPIRPYGIDCDGGDHDNGRSISGSVLVSAGVNDTSAVGFFSPTEDVSFTKVNRGDKI